MSRSLSLGRMLRGPGGSCGLRILRGASRRARCDASRRMERRTKLVGGRDEADNPGLFLHLPDDLASLAGRQLVLGESNAVETAARAQRPVHQGCLIGTEEVGDLSGSGLRRETHDGKGTFA